MKIVVSLLFLASTLASSFVNEEKYSVAKDKRYLIYDVNPGEGFNLRRDVYMRVANTVRLLRKTGDNFVLVLPPWGGLYHWEKQRIKQQWGLFFDLQSLDKFVPVIEFEQWLKEVSSSTIEQVVYLQHYKEGWGNEYKIKYDIRECMDGDKYYMKDTKTGLWKGWFFRFSEVFAKQFECVSIQGDSATLKQLVLDKYPNIQTVFIDRAETILHEDYGGLEYWRARRSMRYAEHLRDIANQFRSSKWSSTDELDDTVLAVDWRDDKSYRKAKGGNYICAHWRRKDFVRAHATELPSIKGTATALDKLAVLYNVTSVFLASDAPANEVSELRENMKSQVIEYDSNELSDGEIAIVDQIICSHSRYFTGSHVSTFSFRIQEDREILGFAPETTFNRLCPDNTVTCEQPAKWKIVY